MGNQARRPQDCGSPLRSEVEDLGDELAGPADLLPDVLAELVGRRMPTHADGPLGSFPLAHALFFDLAIA